MAAKPLDPELDADEFATLRRAARRLRLQGNYRRIPADEFAALRRAARQLRRQDGNRHPLAPADEFAVLRRAARASPFRLLPAAMSNAIQNAGRQLKQLVSGLVPGFLIGAGLGTIVFVVIINLFGVVSWSRSQPTLEPFAQGIGAGPTPTWIGTEPTPTPLPTLPRTATSPPRTLLPSATIPTLAELPLFRFAILSEITGPVQVRRGDNGEWQTATELLTILPGDAVLTDEAGAVKITLSERFIVRLNAQTQLTLTEIIGPRNRPEIYLQLEFGKLWVIAEPLNDGVFEVHLPVGVAAVYGAYMSAEYNSTVKTEIITCLEGQCNYRNAQGQVALTALQQVEAENGGPPGPVHSIDMIQFQDWGKDKIPEVISLTPTLTPSRTPTSLNTATEPAPSGE